MKEQTQYRMKTMLFLLICTFITAIVLSPDSTASNVKKKNGTVDQRNNDLDELCKDWVYYRTMILKYNKEGDENAVVKARSNFAAVNRDLSEYHDNDVYTTCAKYDTKENINKYLR